MTATVDPNAPVEYTIEGKESMGNGATVKSGHASVLLSNAGKLSFPNQSLTVRELFPGETVEFPFSALDEKTRTDLRTLFLKSSAFVIRHDLKRDKFPLSRCAKDLLCSVESSTFTRNALVAEVNAARLQADLHGVIRAQIRVLVRDRAPLNSRPSVRTADCSRFRAMLLSTCSTDRERYRQPRRP